MHARAGPPQRRGPTHPKPTEAQPRALRGRGHMLSTRKSTCWGEYTHMHARARPPQRRAPAHPKPAEAQPRALTTRGHILSTRINTCWGECTHVDTCWWDTHMHTRAGPPQGRAPTHPKPAAAQPRAPRKQGAHAVHTQKHMLGRIYTHACSRWAPPKSSTSAPQAGSPHI
jgi:hypothetical protein